MSTASANASVKPERELQKSAAEELQHAIPGSRGKRPDACEYIAGMSHDLRTPLNAIIGFSELLKDGLIGKLTPEQADCVADIWQSGKQLHAMIEDMLDAAKLQIGRVQIQLDRNVDIRSFLAECLPGFLLQAEGRHIQFQMPSDLGVGDVDTGKVKKIITALLSSAIGASTQGGKVELGMSRVKGTDMDSFSNSMPFPFAGDKAADFIRICCADHGVRPSPDECARLFMSFDKPANMRGEPASSSRGGLATVTLLVEFLKGALAADMSGERATRIIVWLPLH